MKSPEIKFVCNLLLGCQIFEISHKMRFWMITCFASQCVYLVMTLPLRIPLFSSMEDCGDNVTFAYHWSSVQNHCLGTVKLPLWLKTGEKSYTADTNKTIYSKTGEQYDSGDYVVDCAYHVKHFWQYQCHLFDKGSCKWLFDIWFYPFNQKYKLMFFRIAEYKDS